MEHGQEIEGSETYSHWLVKSVEHADASVRYVEIRPRRTEEVRHSSDLSAAERRELYARVIPGVEMLIELAYRPTYIRHEWTGDRLYLVPIITRAGEGSGVPPANTGAANAA